MEAERLQLLICLIELTSKTSGYIYLDGCDINNLDKYTLRNNISVIPQSPYIFNMSIKENLNMVSERALINKLKMHAKYVKFMII